MAVELESVPGERAAEGKENKAAEEGCPVERPLELDFSPVVPMVLVGSKCRRPLHNAPQGSDERPVCLMHSKDPNKAQGELFEAFWREFELILEAAGENEAHFEGFSFPKLDLGERRFAAICRFGYATFTQDVSFVGATFTQDVSFVGATFTQRANFNKATFTHATFYEAKFKQDTDFTNATFTNANFVGAKFRQGASFTGATFAQHANFTGAIFVVATLTQDATFTEEATFTHDTSFARATFTERALFVNATFTEGAAFVDATFTKGADFSRATFTERADFLNATFTEGADFSRATFTKMANFEGTKFRGTATWRASRFLESAAFRYTKFEPQFAEVPSAVFALASWSEPEKIIFDYVDLSQALFHNCDVSEVWFTSSVHWAKRGSHGDAVFEESVPLKYATVLERDGERDYRAVAQIYQQLKKNYDTRLDYWTANEFHFGEMEMKRLVTPIGGRLLRLRRWMHRCLSLTAWYRYASDYGNSYRKPLLRLLAVLVLFAGLFPLPGVGLRHSEASFTEKETYGSVWRLGSSVKQNLQGESKLVGKSMLVAVDMATFQRNPEYAPAYPCGRALAIAETLLTSTLFALFLLAIRRQFRR